MFNLILKDVLIQKRTAVIALIYVFVATFAFQSMKEMVFTVVIITVTYMLVMTSCAYDDRNKSDLLLNSLPYKRSDIVLAKYLSIFVFELLGTIVYILATFIISVSGLKITVYTPTVDSILATLFSVALLNGVYFPVYFKTGYIKAKVLSFILFFVFFFGVQIIYSSLSDSSVKWLKQIAEVINQTNEYSGSFFLPAAALGILLISYALSLKIYRNRDF